MITKLVVKNFKRLRSVEIELGSHVVFVGPNNSGKSSAFQALTLWDAAWRRWSEKREKKDREGNRLPQKARVPTGVALNRRELHAIPIPSAKLLWTDLHTRETSGAGSTKETRNVLMNVTVEGIHLDNPWICGIDFDFANEESFYCRLAAGDEGQIPKELTEHPIVYLPPLSGLADREFRKERGEISLLIGQGQTAQVLRNLCWQLYSLADKRSWERLTGLIREMFSVELLPPAHFSGEQSARVVLPRGRRSRARHFRIWKRRSAGDAAIGDPAGQSWGGSPSRRARRAF